MDQEVEDAVEETNFIVDCPLIKANNGAAFVGKVFLFQYAGNMQQG